MTEQIFEKSEGQILDLFIKEELEKNQFKRMVDLPLIVKKKRNLTLVFSLLNIAFLLTVFFHVRFNFYFLEVLNILVYVFFLQKYNTVNYLKKEAKNRPDEEISYIVATAVAGVTENKKEKYLLGGIIGGTILLTCIIFAHPYTMYEHTVEGYYVRFYTKGLIQEEVIEIPDTYKGRPVVGIRGNVYANLPKLTKIILPDTINTIRGYAFADCENLVEVDMPETLEYLGGGCFEDCVSLQNVSLPQGLTEVKGDTFKNCRNLEEIIIPEGVTRIGGHAFEECWWLEKVTLPSTLEKIGYSAFRGCSFLEEITVPENTYIDEYAFIGCDAEILYMEE